MIVRGHQSKSIKSKSDLVEARKLIMAEAVKGGMSSTRQTHLRTASSELLTNMLKYAGGGDMRIEVVEYSGKQAIRVVFRDQGPGIDDLEQAMKDGYSTGDTLGNGLSSVKRLVDNFTIETEKSKGTQATILQWF